MKIVLLGLIWSVNLFASSVSELSFGSCWVKEGGEEFKFSSFKEEISRTLHEDDLMEFLERFDQNYSDLLKSSKKEVEGFLHCGSYGSSIVLNLLHEGRNRFCLWFGQTDGVMKLISAGSLPAHKDGPCLGEVFGSYLLRFNSEVVSSKEMSEKMWPYFKGRLLEIRPIGSSMLSIKMRREFYLQGSESMNLLDEFKEKNSEVISVEPSRYNTINGEFYPIKIFSVSF